MSGDFENTWSRLDKPYAVLEVIVSVMTVAGNLLVLVAFKRERKLRRRTNYYIVSLAAADLMVGLIGIPCAILASVGLPRQIHFCLFSVSLLIVLCTISIFSLVAVSLDRYWAILYPMSYSRHVNSKFAMGIICLCWIMGGLVGFLPLFGWNAGYNDDQECLFTRVMDYNYLVFLYFTTIVGPALLLAAFYSHIYNVILKQLRQMVSMNETGSLANGFNTVATVRILTEARRKEVKATQNLSIIVLFFIICWMPLYTINCIQAFCSSCVVSNLVMNWCIILSHLNSAGNPLLYAYRLSDFRNAFRSILFTSSTSSSENVVIGGVGSTPRCGEYIERGLHNSVPKHQPLISITFNPRKYRFKKDSRKLFKFEKGSSSNMDMKLTRMAHMRNTATTPLSADSSSSINSSNCNLNGRSEKFFYDVFSSRRQCRRTKSNYAYLNSVYVYGEGDSEDTVSKRKRVLSAQDDVSTSYVLMVNGAEENGMEVASLEKSPERDFLKPNFFSDEGSSSSKGKILKRRHSTDV